VTPKDPLLSWLDGHLVPLDTEAGVATVAKALAPHAVVAAGEATHGTKQFFELKHRLFRQLVEQHGFRTLAMEMDHRAAAAVDAYLQSGSGDLEALVRGSYFFFEAREIVALLRWMRQHNETSARKVRFFGFDLQEEQKVVVQRQCGDRSGCRVFMRDGFMAENVLAQGGGTFVWAHNGHIAHFEAADGWRPMGYYLREKLAAGYYAVVLEFDEGGFIAPAGGELPTRRQRTIPHLGDRRVAEYVLPAAPPEALAHLFARARADDWFVDLGDADEGLRRFFEDNRKLQSYGAVPPKAGRNYEAYAPLHESFDGLIFVSRTDGYTFPP
jgi:erythromycin esterase-like protein